MIRAMNILFAIALTTGLLSAIWGWVAVALGLLSWAGFLGCTAYFACPQGGLKGLVISTCTVMSGVAWALVIITLFCAGHLYRRLCDLCRQRRLAFGFTFTGAGAGLWLRHEK